MLTETRFGGRRQVVKVSLHQGVTLVPLVDEIRRGKMVIPDRKDVSAHAWVLEHLQQMTEWLNANGALLLRGFNVTDADAFRQVVEATQGTLLNYTHRSTPRKSISAGIYSSTEYPADQHIPQHNEMSYTQNWPTRLFFYCAVKPGDGGQTPLADSKRMYQCLPADLIERFDRHGVMYVRNYGLGLDLSWQDVFQTEEVSEVERYCTENGIQFEWLSEGRLRTRQVCQATIRDKHSGQGIWFNQAHLFHVSSLPPETERELRLEFCEIDLPRNTLFGDGTPIPAADLATIRAAYQQEELVFDWEEGDILIVDNETMSHGRRPFKTPRSIMVAMT
ncbi:MULTISPECIES: TauD/TfdA family dioxygenase [Serratia]|uniref:TauD/TfdA family dioxygenase n=1 Tax=Serratia sp. PAMC26656 TaxID=2775909 RepID=UPI0018F64728|nr:TauD/TfdA family dioxygenase [Serratia sp. PAMC26656]MBJ7892275.1 TauD/TfdA family dioxygenase [Serratia sp. PAMC26656]